MSEKIIVSPVAADLKAHMKRGKIVSADEAVRVIRNGDTIALDGVVGGGAPDELIAADPIPMNKPGKRILLQAFFTSHGALPP